MKKPTFGYMVVYQYNHDPETYHVQFDDKERALDFFYSIAEDDMMHYVKFYEQTGFCSDES